MKVSIIVPVLVNSLETKPDNWLWLKKCLHSIKKNSKENHEIIVVTNNGNPIQVPLEGIKVIHNQPQGQCQAVNLGIAAAENEYVMIIDEDMVFPINWEEITEKAKEYPFISGTLMERGGSFLVNSCGDSPLNFDEQKFEQDSLTMAEPKWENGFGFPLVCKKEFWQKLGGYDEQFDPWGSNCDSDLEYKVMLSGSLPMRWRGTIFYHFAQVSGTFAPEMGGFVQGNVRKFESKWGFARARAPEIWSCDFTIPKDKLLYKPSWAKLEDNPYVV
jgi:glycosyltransferase involved in cell wall biosynthesis